MGDPIPRYKPIDASLFVENRKKLCEQIKENCLVVCHANDLMPKDGDDWIGFKQNSNLFYLSGIDQEETLLIIYPDAPNQAWREMLFLKKTSPKTALWEGDKYTKEGATQVSGITEVHWLQDFYPLLRQLMIKAHGIYLNTNEHLRAVTEVESRDKRFLKWCQATYPLHDYHRLAPIMAKLRTVKSPIEIELIRQACHITQAGFLEMLPHVKPDVMEYELEASLIQSFIRRRARGFAYSPIIASGPRNNVLHYTDNSQACRAGELILIDAAAEYAGYNADMTRVIPVNRHFTPRQKAIYHSVLHVMEAAKKLLVIGTNLATYHQEVGQAMEKELVNLGLLSMQEIKEQDAKHPAYKKYFMHDTSHHLGLGVHDLADNDLEIAPNMVLTIEPGIYIPEEAIGIRLENNFVVGKEGLEDLMADIPLSPEAIEEAMNG